MRPFSLLVKPVGGDCNLRCKYCFYRSHPGGQMHPAVFERAIASYMALPFAGKSVALQGGEPLLADPAIRRILAQSGAARSVQTNATLVTDAVAEELADGEWLVGASLDGPRELDAARDGSFDAAVRGIRALEAAGAEYNILCVVSRVNAARPAEVYHFLRDTFTTRCHQYIECTSSALAVGAEEWGSFLVGLFDEWAARDSREISVRLFDSILSQMLQGEPTQCSFSDTCAHYLVVEHDGSVYPCDFYVTPELRLGNVATHTWEEMVASPAYRAFARRKEEALPAKCRDCRHFAFCRGDCPRSRQSLCAGWLRFFDHALPRLAEMAEAAVG